MVFNIYNSIFQIKKFNEFKIKYYRSIFKERDTANNVYPVNLGLHFIGIAGWLVVAIAWNDRALIVVNSVALAIFANGIIAYAIK